MNREQAEKKAKELWGDNAVVGITDNGYYIVGEKTNIFYAAYGWGRNWEEAFKNSEKHFN